MSPGFGYDDERNFVYLYLTEAVPRGTGISVSVDFEGVLNDDMNGFYRSSYARAGNNDTAWLGVTHFESTDARRAFPCLDEPALKAVFRISLGRPRGFATASNMPIDRAGVELDPPVDGYVMVGRIGNKRLEMPEWVHPGCVNPRSYRLGIASATIRCFRMCSSQRRGCRPTLWRFSCLTSPTGWFN